MESNRDVYTISVEAECVTGTTGLVGAKASVSYELAVHSYSFEVEDQAYLMNDEVHQFSVTPIAIDPVDSTLLFNYETSTSSGESIPSDWLAFD